MTRRRRKKKNSLKPILIFFAVIILAVIVIGVLQSYNNVDEEIEEKREYDTYPVKYSEYVEKYCKEYDVPESVIYSMMLIESNYRPTVTSNAGACGLMQVTPETLSWLAPKLGEKAEELDIFDPEVNIRYGTYYTSFLYKRYGDWDCVYAAYNAGHGNVDAWLSDPSVTTDGKLTNIPYEETKNHVVKVKRARAKYIEIYSFGG